MRQRTRELVENLAFIHFRFTETRRATIRHLGLGELPRTSAKRGVLQRVRTRERSGSLSSRTRLGTNAGEKKTSGLAGRKRRKKERCRSVCCRSGATTSYVICDVSPKRPNLQSSFLHVGHDKEKNRERERETVQWSKREFAYLLQKKSQNKNASNFRTREELTFQHRNFLQFFFR